MKHRQLTVTYALYFFSRPQNCAVEEFLHDTTPTMTNNENILEWKGNMVSSRKKNFEAVAKSFWSLVFAFNRCLSGEALIENELRSIQEFVSKFFVCLRSYVFIKFDHSLCTLRFQSEEDN